MKHILFTFFVVLLLTSVSCREKEPLVIVLESAITDYDGNTYNAVQIGDKCWMKENLRTTHYADGTPVDTDLFSCVADPVNAPDEYGYLYRWDAAVALNPLTDTDGSVYAWTSIDNITQEQGICPDGWHLPTSYEWIELGLYVSRFTDDVVGVLCSTIGWGPDSNGIHSSAEINSFEFSALPCRTVEQYSGSKPISCFWSSTDYGDFSRTDMVTMDYYNNTQFQFDTKNHDVASVRCVRNK